MGFGIFGKLPQKRDFIALGLPRNVLEPFESWLQSAVAASRSELGPSWQESYLVAPVWRFWIGRGIMGACSAGALIPSVDGVGRFFPLAILFSADAGSEIAPPPFSPLDEWYAAIEARLLTVLDPETAVEIDRLLDGLPMPEMMADGPEPQGVEFRRGIVWTAPEGDANDLLSALVEADYWMSVTNRSFWWTSGGNAGVPIVYARNGLPDPFFYTSMIKGEAP